jgi:ectoine hydroxylase-related dioxygenase (phytanoyl-CoA dioxygenase family)
MTTEFAFVNCGRDQAWLEKALVSLRRSGAAVVEGVLDDGFLEETRAAMYRAQAGILSEISSSRLERAGELGVLRLMLKFDHHFYRFLELPEVLAVVDATLSPTAILHLQNGFILPSFPEGKAPEVFQNRFHQDFPRVLNGYMASLNVFFAIDAFTRQNGATLFVPGSHQRMQVPETADLEANAVAVECGPGSMVVFDSTLYHAAGANVSGKPRLAINHQFTRSYIKPQIDYVRALGDAAILGQPPRSQQLLGWYTRVVTSLDEYYRPTEERLYRKGQG